MNTIKICLIGARPKGTSVLERIRANSAELCGTDTVGEVHVIGPVSARPGARSDR